MALRDTPPPGGAFVRADQPWEDPILHDPETGCTVARIETVVSTDRAAQIRVIRSAYEIVAPDGSVTKRIVEWPFRYSYRFEVELLLERAGSEVEAVYGGYEREPFNPPRGGKDPSESGVMLFLARRD